MKAVVKLVGFVGVAIAAFSVAPAFGQPGTDVVPVGDQAYMLSRPHLVAWGEAEIVSVSPGGRYIVSVNMADGTRGIPLLELAADPAKLATARVELTLFDTRTLDSRRIFTASIQEYSRPGEVTWFGDSLGVVRIGDGALVLRGTQRAIEPLGVLERIRHLAASTDGRFGLIQLEGPERAVVVDGSLKPLQTYPLPFLTAEVLWSDELGAFVLTSAQDGTTLVLRPGAERLVPETIPPETLAALRSPQAKPGMWTLAEEDSGWELQSVADPETRLPGGTGEQARLLGDGATVAYRSEGALFIRRVQAVSKELAEAREAAERTALISNAKQLALALIMFSNDNNDRLPDAGQPWHQAIEPYLGNSQIMQGFVATFEVGLDLTAIQNPSEYVLGYIPGPGGRAVAYADGHVKWVPDEPRS